ncbi:MAG TPA: deoxycytidylate deaminase, partial [Alphaproteobacteria bacterium]|nr:deoxycytidylate deaminase [Alphaproteobacteria bacterium]
MMQHAVDVVGTSPHPTNKIASSLRVPDGSWLAATNLWPPAIEAAFGHDTRIGNASGTIHAEIACLLKAPCTNGAEIFITDPPCPNCVKAMAEAGIKRIYIDHKGFGKDFAQRRGAEFQHLSLPLCREAGIGVFEINRKERLCRCLQKGRKGDPARDVEPDAPYATAKTKQGGNTKSVKLHARKFLSFEGDPDRGKYTPVLEPLTRLLMAARRDGTEILQDSVTSSRIPTARELV